MNSSPLPERDHVSARPCTGRLTPAGEPRHLRPAGLNLAVSPQYAVDYGVRGNSGHGLVPMDLRPLLDAVAARYDGCQPCEQHHLTAIVASPALTTHVVGVALLTLTPIPGSEAPARLVVQKLDPAGAAIALTIRARGLLAAVGVARAMPDAHRLAAVTAALSMLLPVHWYQEYVSNRYPPQLGETRSMHHEDATVLDDLRTDGFLPA